MIPQNEEHSGESSTAGWNAQFYHHHAHPSVHEPELINYTLPGLGGNLWKRHYRWLSYVVRLLYFNCSMGEIIWWSNPRAVGYSRCHLGHRYVSIHEQPVKLCINVVWEQWHLPEDLYAKLQNFGPQMQKCWNLYETRNAYVPCRMRLFKEYTRKVPSCGPGLWHKR